MELEIVVILFMIFIALVWSIAPSLKDIKELLNRQNELKEKELKAKYPDMDI